MRKKLFAVIMSIMMMVTFMPAMAFATTATPVDSYNVSVVTDAGNTVTVKFANDYKSMTAKLGTYEMTVATSRTFDTAGTVAKGAVVVKNDATATTAVRYSSAKYDDVIGATAVKYGDELVEALQNASTYYYDFTGATFARSTGYALPSALTAAQFQSITTTSGAYEWTGIDMKVPAELVTATVPATTHVFVAKTAFTNYTLSFYYDPATFDATSKSAQEVKAELKMVVTDNTQWTPTIEAGTVTQTFNLSQTLTAQDAEFYLDAVSSTTKITLASYAYTDPVYYSGAEHKLVMKEMNGFSVSYEKQNATNGKWEAADAITFKDAGDYKYRATVKNTDATKSADTQVYSFNFKVNPAKINVTLAENTECNVYEGDKYEVADFVKIVKDASVVADKDVLAVEAAIKADKEAIKDFLKTYADLTATPKEYNASQVDLKLAYKTVGVDAVAKAKAKANWNFTETGDTALLTVKPATKLNDIDFIGGATKKVHIKNAAKIKSAKKVTLKAEAVSGVAPTFKKLSGNSKISVAKNGKVTLKKGLKKGTYKVKVKAYGAVGNGYMYAKSIRTYTFKVVK